jgi:hypothetical protein
MRRATFGLVLLVVMAANASGQSQSQAPRQNTQGGQQRANPEQRGSEQAPFVVKILPTQETQQKTAASEQNGPVKPSDAWTLGDKIAAIASILAFLQFVALTATVLVLMRTARRQLRAYVNVVHGIANPQIAVGGTPRFEVVIHNFGQTPAHHVSSWIQMQVGTATFVGDLPSGSAVPGHSVIAPTGEFVLWAVRPEVWTKDEVEGMTNGRLAVHVYGEITYRDIFKKERYTRFRLLTGGPFGLRDNTLRHADDGNITDDDE